ncbi:hypothetical protein J7384_01880 [Endozoicomonas sp. G2_1]|uniref:hypothetical protein n=1 Tax=Endozoicomonas sp. G2_1 TaxID=2821091 RepID=UPI001ADC27BD|nr:hypothetical protein [Endozoicomonas sp. G2_1]MBO9489102.1 hypothetical protein [Endozoicomonas sp. G2_1]
MSNKISVFEIIKGNFDTLYDVDTGKRSYMDIATFYFLPLSITLYVIHQSYLIPDKLIGDLLTASTLLAGLLLNLLLMVSNTKAKLPVPELGAHDYDLTVLKRTIVQELFFNVSSASLVSFFLLVFCILGRVFSNSLTISCVIIFLSIHLFFSFLMITRRTYKLLLNL